MSVTSGAEGSFLENNQIYFSSYRYLNFLVWI